MLNEKTVEKFLERHPTFRIVTPQNTQPTTILCSRASAASVNTGVSTSPSPAVNVCRMTVRTELKDALKMRAEGADDVMLSVTEISRIALRIEEAMVKTYEGTTDKYKQRFRSLILNIKDAKNKCLFRNILLGNLTPMELASDPIESLASEELSQRRENQRKKVSAFKIRQNVVNLSKFIYFLRLVIVKELGNVRN